MRGVRGIGTATLMVLSQLAACQCDEALDAVRGGVTGRICDGERGTGVPGVEVVVAAADGARRELVTDGEGGFVVHGLVPGAAVVRASVGAELRELDVEIVARETAVLVDPACRELPGVGGVGGIEGRICNRHTGALVTQAEVTVQLANGELAITTTDEQGRFAFASLPAGDQLLSVQGEGFQRSFLVEVVAGEVTSLDLSDDCTSTNGNAGTLSGALCDDGAALMGAWVSATDAAGDLREDLTDTDGAFFLNALAPGPAEVEVVRAPDLHESFVVTVVAGRDTVVPNDALGGLACGGDGGDTEGAVEGTLCAPDGSTGLADATVYIVRPDGTRAQTTTDAGGHFVLQGAPSGPQTLHVEKGSYSATIGVVVPANGTLVIPEEDCEVSLAGVRIAVVTGEWDDVGTVLHDVGIDPSTITTYAGYVTGTSWVTTLLESYATLSSFDIVFINCGADLEDALTSPTAIANLQQFVTQGGGVYASDLSYDLIEAAFPSSINFAGDDTVWQDAVQGEPADALPAVVSDPILASALGTTNVSIAYPYGFAVMESVASGVRVYIRGNAPLWTGQTLTNVPHTVGVTVGQGRVVYTSFHQEPGVNATLEQVLRQLMFEL
ncbi:MAG: carboxypeptidase regulatory-like domain-containing protein [Deltaproteobacteria bacterium]|nr:carboxypeptidase regulatory-like domain-containing protein [Deltaproteobacteria bacterium]